VPVRDVGEDAAFGGLVDELPVLHIEDGDHRAGRLVHDPVDQLQSLGGPLVNDHHRYVRPLSRGDARHVWERGLSGDDVVAQLRHREGDLVQANPWAVGNQDAEAGGGFSIHLRVVLRPDATSAPVLPDPRKE
jgi:hypothetical protein